MTLQKPGFERTHLQSLVGCRWSLFRISLAPLRTWRLPRRSTPPSHPCRAPGRLLGPAHSARWTGRNYDDAVCPSRGTATKGHGEGVTIYHLSHDRTCGLSLPLCVPNSPVWYLVKLQPHSCVSSAVWLSCYSPMLEQRSQPPWKNMHINKHTEYIIYTHKWKNESKFCAPVHCSTVILPNYMGILFSLNGFYRKIRCTAQDMC